MKSSKSPGPTVFLEGRIWHYRFQRDGARIQRSTGETDQVRAEAVAWAAWDGRSPIPTLKQLAWMWLDAREGIVSQKYYDGVKTIAKLHLYQLADTKIDRIRTADIEAARKRYLRKHSKGSANLWLSAIRMLFNWAAAKGRKLIQEVSWSVPKIRTQKKPRVLLPQSRAATWLSAVDRLAGEGRWGLATAIRLMLGLGLRESEALSARWEWLDLERGIYTPGKTKGKEAAPIAVPAWLIQHLSACKVARKGLIVPSPYRRQKAYRPGATRHLIMRANAETGVAGVTPHRLRGTYATLLSEHGVPVQDIKAVLRHKDLRTTVGYLEVDLSRVAKAQERIAENMGIR